MSGGNFPAPTQAATALIEYRLRLVAPKLPEGRKDPNLEVKVNNKNEVIMSCNTGIFGADAKQVQIMVKLGAYEFGLVALFAEQIHTKEPGFKFPLVRCYGPRKKQPGQVGRAKGLDGVILIGKDQNGVCYISLMRKDPPHIKFAFVHGMWADMVDATTNQPVSEAVVSDYYSQSWAKVIAPLVSHVLSTRVYDFREDPANQQQQQGAGGGGGWQNNQSQGGGNTNGYTNGQQQAPVAVAPANDTGWGDDIPM